MNVNLNPMGPRGMRSRGVMRIRRTYGLMTKVARGLNLSLASVQLWKTVPLDHVFAVARITGIRPEELRPDFFINDPMRRSDMLKARAADASNRARRAAVKTSLTAAA